MSDTLKLLKPFQFSLVLRLIFLLFLGKFQTSFFLIYSHAMIPIDISKSMKVNGSLHRKRVLENLGTEIQLLISSYQLHGNFKILLSASIIFYLYLLHSICFAVFTTANQSCLTPPPESCPATVLPGGLGWALHAGIA